MGKADFPIDGYQIFWYSNDHDPPHFNIEKKGHWAIRVKFTLSNDKNLEFDIVWQNQTRGPSSKEQRLFRKYIKKHKEHLLKEWEIKICKRD